MLKDILIFFCGISLVVGVPLIKERKKEEDVGVLKASEHRFSDFYAFQYSLSDGQHRQEIITFDESAMNSNGISVRGSYTIQLEDGSTQAIFYVSDSNGHRISIGQPFTESEITQKPIVSVRRAPTRPTRKLEIERNLKKQSEEEDIEDHTENLANDYDIDEDDDYESEVAKKSLKFENGEKRRKL